MGDMTTPDFDDLLAAFDIPDLDPKDSMDSGQEEASAKPAGGKTAAGEAPEVPADEPTVSVIVKNSLSPRSCDAAPAASAASAPPVPSRGKEAPHYQATPLPNGIEAPGGSRSPRPASPASDCEGWTGTRDGEGDGAGGPASSAAPSPPHPAAKPDEQSDEEEEEEEEEEAGGRSPRSPLFPSGPGPEGLTQGEERPPSPTGQCRAAEDERGGAMGTAGSSPPSTSSSSEEEEEEDLMEMMEAGDDDDEDEDEKQLDVESEVEMEEQSSEEPGGVAGDGSGNDPPPAAPAAAPATPETPRPAPSPCPAPVPSPSGPIPADCAAAKGSPRPFPSPPLLGRQIKREPESPASVSSNESSSSSRPLKVRIKTIKTSGGGIMRTVTRVPSDAAQPTADTDGDTDSGEVKEEGQRGPGAGKGGEVISLQLLNGAVVKGTVLPSSAFHTASTAMLMAASIAQKATLPATTATAAPATPGKTVSKSVHLASLNLVPQTVPSKPAAPGKVAAAAAAGTGAAPRNQTPLVEAFHKLLNGKNPLPTYKPNLNPPADSCLALPPSGYRCLECGDSFALERSLARHYDRRSIRIDVTCNHCARRMAFFNRCSLMLHAREHKDKGLVMQCSNLVMKPIALEQMVGQPDVAGVPLPNASGNASGSARAEHPSPVLPPYPDPALVECDTFSCNECGLQLPDRLALAAHFQLCTPSTAPQVCQLCQMLLPSKCSYVAHYRLHKSKSPYICPECGGVCRAAHIQAHVKDVCFHFTRKVGYKCPQCGVVYGGVTSVKSHIQDVHCEAFHKCPICPMAFKSAPSAHSHIYTQHPGISNQQAKVIHKCAMCDTVFTHQPLLNTHFDQHLTKQRVSVFKCPQCPVLFAQKRTMVEHVKTNHSSGRSEEASESRPAAATTPAAATETAAAAAAETPEPEPSPKPSADSTDSPTDESSSSPKAVLSLQRRKEMRLKLKNAGWTCGQCQTWFPEREEYITHMKKDHGKAMKKFPCRLCERSFCSAPSLRRHVRVNHEGIKRVYSCRHCIEGKRTFSSRLTLEKHLQVIHSINLADHVQDQENLFERVSIKTSIRKRGGALERWGSDPAKRRRGGGGGSPPYRCMKCGYTTGSFADFHQHIPQHRTGSSSYQCRQCGLCFAARPSLGRHLFIVHGVKESESAVLAEQAADTDAAQLGGGHVICDVCGKTFDNEPLLKTHFRTHGMAFIKAKQNGLDK